MRRFAILLLAPLLIGNADPATIPPQIRAMLDAAIAAGNEGEVATIVKFARAADPASGDAVQAIAEQWRASRVKEREFTVRQAGAFDLWKGRAEVGGFITTGNSETAGATAIVDVTREGLQWRHKLRLQGDYAESLGIPTREHLLVAYEPNYKIDDRHYVYGAGQFETDRFLGYTQRYSASVGGGYAAIRQPTMTLAVELGPAFRHTQFTDGRIESSIASRGTVDFDWKLTPTITLSQDVAGYLQRFNSTVASTTAVSARVLGPLAASLSYAIQYESEPPAGRRTTDTIGRASLVYTF